MKRSCGIWFPVLALAVLVSAELASPAGAGTTERVSVSSSGVQGNGASEIPCISADGRLIAFRSYADNLVPGDTNGVADAFVHDRQSGVTERVSVDSSGVQGNSQSHCPSISADGRFVAFASQASNLVPGDTNGVWDVFVHDRLTGITDRVSVDSSGAQGNMDSLSSWLSISADGRFVVFESLATNLVAGDTNGRLDIFVHDGLTGLTERVSVSSSGDQGNDDSSLSDISADGRLVAFRSYASNLVPGDTNGSQDVFVHDRVTGATERVSVSSSGEQGNDDSLNPSISADGRFVAFRSGANNLVPGDTNGFRDVFVHDRQAGTTERVSVSSSGEQGNDRSEGPSINSDGRFVAFHSCASNLVAGDTNGVPGDPDRGSDIFVRDRLTGTTERVSVSTTGEEAESSAPGFTSRYGSISSDGQAVAFQSIASNLVPGDTNHLYDIFVHELAWPAELSAESGSGVPGSAVVIPIALSNSDQVAGVQFDLVYHPAILTNAAAQNGALIADATDWTLVYNVIAPGRIRVMAWNTQSEPLSPGSGAIVQCTFTVSPSATRGQTSPLDIQNPVLSDKDGGTIPSVGIDGVFTVIAVHHFVFDTIPSPQHGDATTPLQFMISVWAKDQNDNLASLYNDYGVFSDLTGTLDFNPATPQPEATVLFTNGVLDAMAVIREATQPDRITVADWADPSATGVSNDFAVIGNGDPTGDGETNIQDIVLAVNIALEVTTVTPAEFAAADANNDGFVDVRDVIIIQNIILGPHGGGGGEMLSLHGKALARAIGPVVAAGKPPAPGAKKIAVPALIDSAQGVAGFNFDLAYDSKTLSPVEVRAGALISGKADWLVNGNLAKNPLRVLVFSGQSLPLSGKGGTLVEVVFAEIGKGGADSLRLGRTVVSDSAGNALPRAISLGKPRAVK